MKNISFVSNETHKLGISHMKKKYEKGGLEQKYGGRIRNVFLKSLCENLPTMPCVHVELTKQGNLGFCP